MAEFQVELMQLLQGKVINIKHRTYFQVNLVQNFLAPQVVAKNRVGETNMDTRLEVVTEEPGFIAPLKDCQTKLGNTETFECVVKVSGFRDEVQMAFRLF